MQDKKNKNKKNNTQNIAETLREISNSKDYTDVLGSYTGTPKDGGVTVQAADDLSKAETTP